MNHKQHVLKKYPYLNSKKLKPIGTKYTLGIKSLDL